jgi:protein-disulfide isomerase
MKNPWIIIGVIAVVLIGGSIWYSGNVSESNNEGLAFKSHIVGREDATVTLVEYSDFQCPACASFQPTLKEVLAEYGDSLKFEYKHFPLPIHPKAEPAARAAEAAGQQDAFFEFHDLLFANQTTWSNSANPLAFFVKYAEELNLDVDLFKRHYNASLVKDKVRENSQEARGLGITGTPTFFLNGEKMQIQTYQDFKDQIAAALGITSSTTVPISEVKFGI